MQVLRVKVSPNGIIYLVRTQTFPQTNIPYPLIPRRRV